MPVILQGSLEHFPLIELLGLLAARRQSGTLATEGDGSRLRMVLRDGRIAGASSEDVIGAVAAAASWNGGTFTLDEQAVEDVIAIDVDVPTFIAEVQRRREEELQYDSATTFRVVDEERLPLSPDELKLLIRIGLGRSFAELAAGREREMAATLRRLENRGVIARQEPEPAAVGREPRSRTAGRQIIASLTADGTDGNAYPLLEDEIVLGRASDAIPVTDGSVSSRHARITRTEEGFFIEDLGSRNGTFVNGEKVSGKRLLADNDVVRLGKLIFTFNLATELQAGDTTVH